MDAGGAGRLNRSSPSCLNRSAQRTDFFHGLLRPVSTPRKTPGEGASGVFGPWRQVEQCPVLVARSRNSLRSFSEPGHGHPVGLAVDVGADQDQAAGAALAVGGGDAPMR